MNDQQLIEALRRLDAPVQVDAAFGDALFVRLLGERRPRRDPRVVLLVAAALLAAALVGAAFVAGRLLDRDEPIAELTATTPPPTQQPVPQTQGPVAEPVMNQDFAIVIPPGATPASTPDEVVQAVRALRTGFYGDPVPPRTIASVAWVAPNASFTPESEELRHPDGGAVCCYPDPIWVVEVVSSDPAHRYLLQLWDGSLDIFTARNQATPVPAPTVPPPASDPAAPLVLTTDDGRVITTDVIPIPDPERGPSVGALRSIGGELWGTVGLPEWIGGPGYEFRVDRVTGAIVQGQPPAQPAPDAQPHLRGRSEQDSVDKFGRWSRVPGGIELRDAATGALIRTIPTREGEGHPYRGIYGPTTFDSLWDTDRGSGVVYRIDPATGEDITTIPLGLDTDLETCADPVLVDTVRGLPTSVVVQCDGIAVAIDPSTNRVRRTLIGSIYEALVVNGTWWWLETAGYDLTDDWEAPGALLAVDPAGGPPRVRLDFGVERLGGTEPVLVGDSLWFIVAERAALDQPYHSYPRLVRVPIDELNALFADRASSR